MKILTVIPARKGSKRLPFKNRIKLLGNSLCLWSINAAKEIPFKNVICISTNDKEIINEFEGESNIEINSRPDSLSNDKASLQDVCDDLLSKYGLNNFFFDYVVLLQPTSPLREKYLIEKCLGKVISYEANGLIEVEPIKISSGKIIDGIWKPDYKVGTQSQDIKVKYKPSGRLFIYKVKNNFIIRDNLLAETIGNGTSNNIDNIYDLDMVKGSLERLKERYDHLI